MYREFIQSKREFIQSKRCSYKRFLNNMFLVILGNAIGKDARRCIARRCRLIGQSLQGLVQPQTKTLKRVKFLKY